MLLVRLTDAVHSVGVVRSSLIETEEQLVHSQAQSILSTLTLPCSRCGVFRIIQNLKRCIYRAYLEPFDYLLVRLPDALRLVVLDHGLVQPVL